MKFLSTFIFLIALISCNKKSKLTPQTPEVIKIVEEVTPVHKRPVSIDNGKFISVKGQKMLYGGKDSLQHFDITNYTLKDAQFHYGIGREVFPAL